MSEYIIQDFMDVILEDDDTDEGGVSFLGETVEDFITAAEISEYEPLDVLNEHLIACGVREIIPEEYL